MRSSILLSFVSLISFSYAWPWPAGSTEQLDGLNKRQNNQDTSTNASPGQTSNSGTVQTASGQQTTAPSTKTATTATNLVKTATFLSSSANTNTATSGSDSGSNSGSNQTMFNPVDPPGGVSMLTPNVFSPAQYYKIGDWVHFAWNYTSLQATPTAINVVASCSANSYVYTLASNQSVQPTGSVYWDTGAYQQSAQVPLLTNEYTLIIYDASKPINAAPSAGYLDSYNQFAFAMYSPQPYSNLSSYNCATCPSNGAGSLEPKPLTFLLATVGVTVLSFSWFISGLPL